MAAAAGHLPSAATCGDRENKLRTASYDRIHGSCKSDYAALGRGHKNPQVMVTTVNAAQQQLPWQPAAPTDLGQDDGAVQGRRDGEAVVQFLHLRLHGGVVPHDLVVQRPREEGAPVGPERVVDPRHLRPGNRACLSCPVPCRLMPS